MLNPDAINANTDSFPHPSIVRIVTDCINFLICPLSNFLKVPANGCSGISKWRLCLIPMQLQCILRSLTISLKIWGPSSIWNATDVQGSTSDFKMASFPCGSRWLLCDYHQFHGPIVELIQASFNDPVSTKLRMAVGADDRIEIYWQFPNCFCCLWSHGIPIASCWTPTCAMNITNVVKSMLKTERWSQRIFPWNGGFSGSPVIGSQIISPFAGSANVTPARFKNSQSTRYSAGGGGKGSRGWPSSKDSDSLSTVATRSVEDPVPPVFSKSQIDEGLADKTTADGLKGSLLGTNSSSASLSLYTDSPKSESIQLYQGPWSQISAAMVPFEEATASPNTLDGVVGLLTIYVSRRLKMNEVNQCYDTKELC